MSFANNGLYFNAHHVIAAFVILAALDCLLTYYALTSTTGLAEVNPVMRFAMDACAKVLGQTVGRIVGLLALHYIPFAIALYLVHRGNLSGWGYIIDGCAIFGLVDIWDAWQLHKVGKL